MALTFLSHIFSTWSVLPIPFKSLLLLSPSSPQVFKGQTLEKGSLEEYGIKEGDSIVVIDTAPEPEDPIILQDPVILIF